MRYADFAAASVWSLTGSLVAAMSLGFYLLLSTGTLWTADVAVAFGWLVFSTMGAVCLFWPFMLSYYTYQPVRHLCHTRPRGALYGALWHLLVHCAILQAMDRSVMMATMAIPIVIGAIWGSWLPAAHSHNSHRL